MENQNKPNTNNKRLSLQDFKVKAIDNSKEVEKLMGGLLAAACHRISCTGDILWAGADFD